MARTRLWGEDHTYGEAHREELRKLYVRSGHRTDMADRDWTEFCHYCKRPLELYEMVRDFGQDLADKGVSVTRHLARSAHLPGKLVAYCVDRPQRVELRIHELQREIMMLQSSAQWPIRGFRVRLVNPRPMGAVEFQLTAEEWWQYVTLVHVQHWNQCAPAIRSGEFIPSESGVRRLYAAHALGGSLFSEYEMAGGGR